MTKIKDWTPYQKVKFGVLVIAGSAFVIGFCFGFVISECRDSMAERELTYGYRVLELVDEKDRVVSSEHYDVLWEENCPDMYEEIEYKNLEIGKEYYVSVSTFVENKEVQLQHVGFVPEESDGKIDMKLTFQ